MQCDLQVDPAKGDWAAVERLSARYDVMVDFMVNHISPASDEFQDFLKHGMESRYAEMFIHWNDFWEGGMSMDLNHNLGERRRGGWTWDFCLCFQEGLLH